MENKIKHLEFIQNIITRMNSNSFLIKGWAITLISALFALAANESNSAYAILAFIPLQLFWFLDGFYISQERQYRELYEHVTKQNEINFSLDASAYNTGENTWLCGIFSKTIIPFYGVTLIIVLIVMFLIQ